MVERTGKVESEERCKAVAIYADVRILSKEKGERRERRVGANPRERMHNAEGGRRGQNEEGTDKRVIRKCHA